MVRRSPSALFSCSFTRDVNVHPLINIKLFDHAKTSLVLHLTVTLFSLPYVRDGDIDIPSEATTFTRFMKAKTAHKQGKWCLLSRQQPLAQPSVLFEVHDPPLWWIFVQVTFAPSTTHRHPNGCVRLCRARGCYISWISSLERDKTEEYDSQAPKQERLYFFSVRHYVCSRYTYWDVFRLASSWRPSPVAPGVENVQERHVIVTSMVKVEQNEIQNGRGIGVAP